MKYFILAFKNWNKFNGRANRAEYWYFVLFHTMLNIILNGIILFLIPVGEVSEVQYKISNSIALIGSIFNIVCIIPSLSLSVRRLHDVNKSGWNILWSLTIIGIFYLIYLNIIKGSKEDNHYGAPSNA